MSSMEQSSREPYPYPQPDNDTTRGSTMEQSFQGVIHQKDTSHIKDSPWERLHGTPTLTSVRHSAYHYDPRSPADHLDYAMKGQYDHHGDAFKGKTEVIHQKETLCMPHGRVLKNRIKEQPPHDPLTSDPIKWADKNKKNVNSTKGNVSGHHTTETNQGFSRKHDGGFYTS